jgi:hypothetical protein
MLKRPAPGLGMQCVAIHQRPIDSLSSAFAIVSPGKLPVARKMLPQEICTQLALSQFRRYAV